MAQANRRIQQKVEEETRGESDQCFRQMEGEGAEEQSEEAGREEG